jgi:hypothetical protein
MTKASDEAQATSGAKAPTAVRTVLSTLRGDAGRPAAPVDGRLVAYRRLLLEWEQARKSAATQVAGFRDRIAREFPVLAQPAQMLDKVMLRFNQELGDAIDAAINAQDGTQRDQLSAVAAGIARRYLLTVGTDPLFNHVDANPIAPLNVRQTLGAPLARLVKTLA